MNLKGRIAIAMGWGLATLSVAGAQQMRPASARVPLSASARVPLSASARVPLSASARAQMKPLGAPSAVDRYRTPAVAQVAARQWVETQTQVRQAQFTIPPSSQPLTSPPTVSAPPVGRSAPPVGRSAPPVGPSARSVAPPAGATSPPSSLPMPPSLGVQGLGPPPANLRSGGVTSGDLTPLPQPRLGDVPFGGVSAGPSSNGFATLNNCRQVSGPSGYSAALYSSNGNCVPVNYQAPLATTGVPPNPFAAGPGIANPQGVPWGAVTGGGTSAPAGALLTFGQEAYPVQVGQGILGQPKAYVPGQAVRNWLRYLTP